MDNLIKYIADSLTTYFNSKTVGNGGDYGDSLTVGPFTVHCYFHQWSNINYPSIHLQIVQEAFLGAPLECCGGGVHQLTVDFRISVDSKKQGFSVASSLHEALREWLCYVNGTTPDDSTNVVYAGIPTTNYVYDGEILNLHVITPFTYVRQQEGEI